jgi:hypothetical protein
MVIWKLQRQFCHYEQLERACGACRPKVLSLPNSLKARNLAANAGGGIASSPARADGQVGVAFAAATCSVTEPSADANPVGLYAGKS